MVLQRQLSPGAPSWARSSPCTQQRQVKAVTPTPLTLRASCGTARARPTVTRLTLRSARGTHLKTRRNTRPRSRPRTLHRPTIQAVKCHTTVPPTGRKP
eukprot:5511949-Lingulodinium_polyedra.AAC.1